MLSEVRRKATARWNRRGAKRSPYGVATWLACSVVCLAFPNSAAAAENLDWTHYGNDLANSRFQAADQINPSNVSRLRPAWIFHTGVLDPQASLEVSPIVADGRMFVTSGHDDVFALDAATGRERWSYHPKLRVPITHVSLCCGEVNRGVAFGNGRVFLARLDGVLDALDARTGALLWERAVVDVNAGLSLTMAPQFTSGLVILGSAGGEFKARGQVAAFDAASGNQRWRTFTTLPGPTWQNTSWQHGGAHVWQTPAIDPQLNLLYVATGNAAPDINGKDRAGVNLFSSSIVALDLTTGSVRWNFQEVHHDLWDYDGAQPTMLFDVTKDGKAFPAVGHCSKNGNYYILDRRSGAPLFPVIETPVATKPGWQNASPSQPVSAVEPLTPLGILPGTVDPKKLPADVVLAPQYTPPQEQKRLIQPGDDGGCEFPPAAFSPRTHFVYYGTRYEPAVYQSLPRDDGPNPQGEFLGSSFHEAIPGVTDFGIFGATDVDTGKVVWKIKVAQPAKSGMLIAGDLVFFGEGNGRLHAADARSGQVLFTFDGRTVPNGGGAQAAPIAYVLDGREYIVNAFGGNNADRPNFPPNIVGDAIVAFTI